LYSVWYNEKQGVRQGGVWSPTAYKVFINSLLKIYEENKIGCHIGSIFCGVPTSNPYSSLGSTKHLIMCIETIGFIPFIPCKPAPLDPFFVEYQL
jgi:hypothetical protein